MKGNQFFKALQVCFAVVLFCSLMGCETVKIYISNQTMDNIEVNGNHIYHNQTTSAGTIPPDFTEYFEISRSYGSLATLIVTCPKDIDLENVKKDTIVITEPQYNVFQASAQALTVSIINNSPTAEYGDMPSEDLLEDAEEEPAEDLIGES
jgi:hypothetical protein